jgi:polyisoprenoid-binding protein YceI
MKKSIFKSAFLIVLALTAVSFTTISDKKVIVKDSNIKWKGYKVTGEHEGNIALKEGTLTFNGNDLTGGNFTMDMTSINVTDLEGDSKGKLEGHLKSPDFFAVEANPTATFKITKVEGKGSKVTVTGDLKIRGKSNPATFDMTINDNSATAFLKIDRTKFGIEYNSNNFFENLKDKAIYDEFDLNVNLKF